MARNVKTENLKPAPLYETAECVMLRAPALPVETYLALADRAAEIMAAWPHAADPRVRAALAIGSPALLDALDRKSGDEKEAPRLRNKLRRFLVRMSTRPTPYGMFAGAAAAAWGDTTDICLNGTARTRTRVDMDWLLRFVLSLEASPTIRNQLRWVASTAVWNHFGRLVLSERMPPLAPGPGTRISAAAKPVALRGLELAMHPIHYHELAARLASYFPTAGTEKIERALQQLWENGFLVTELLPPLTVEDPILWVREKLAPITGGKALCVQLDALLRSLAACDIGPVEQFPELVKKAATHVKALGPTQTEMPLQVDLVFATAGDKLSSAIAGEVARLAELLLRLTIFPYGHPNLAAYRQTFAARYGFEREVPLLELLDPEWGIGPLGPLGWTTTGFEGDRANRRAEALQQLALGAIRNRALSVQLDEELLGRLEPHSLAEIPLPDSIDLNLFVLASSAAAIDAGNFQILMGPNVGAPSAGRNLGRFAHLMGEKACTALERLARADEAHHPSRIAAEVVTLPRNYRYANVVIRPAVRRYEVVQGVSAGVDRECVIPMSELVVGIRHGRLYVRWVPRGVEVLFTVGHMLNPDQSSREGHFLAEVSRDGVAQLSGFNWGPAAGFPFLPRVESGRIILQCAQWRLDPKSHGRVPLDRPDHFANWFARWREYWQVPRRVYMSWADNRLLYDLDDREQVEDLRGELVRGKGQGQCLLQEALPAPEHAWLPSADGGRRIVELVVPMQRPAARAEAVQEVAVSRHAPPVPSAVRLRPPGSDWLYLKIYGPRTGENELLAGPIQHLCAELERERLVDRWFFLRYADPEPHLRLRFCGAPERLTGTVLPRLCNWASGLIAGGLCQKFAFDTYDREIERYGGVEAAEVSEALFTADSRFVAELLSSSPLPELAVLAVVTVDDLLIGLGLDHNRRLVWLRSTAAARKQVADEYRARRQSLIAALREPKEDGTPMGRIFLQRRAALALLADRLAGIEADGALTQPPAALYESYMHMHCNRLGVDRNAEPRILGLLLRSLEAIAHLPAGTAEERVESAAGT